MSDRHLDRLFQRFRARGDASALAELYDHVAPELLRISRHLVRDASEAEDVLQSTFLAAIEAADSYDETRRVLPWLVGILARQAGLARRKRRREIEPDRIVRRPEVDPQIRAAEAEFSHDLERALHELPERYREVLRLCLHEGLRPFEIAARLGRAPGTVRMQLQRGLKLLRRGLPLGYAAAGGAMVLASGRGLAAVRDVVLREALARGASFGGLAGSSGGALALAGSKLALLSAGGVLAAAFGWFLSDPWTSPDPLAAEPSLAAAPPAAKPARPRAAERAPERTAVRDQPSPPQVASAPAAAPLLLRGRVVGPAPEEMEAVVLRVAAIARFAAPDGLAVEGHPATDGTFALDVRPLFAAFPEEVTVEELFVSADHPAYLVGEARAAPEPGPSGAIDLPGELRLSLAGVIEGRVQAPASPRPGAIAVAAYRMLGGLPVEPPVDTASCAADGSFRLRVRRGGAHAVVAIADGLRPASVLLHAPPGSSSAPLLLELVLGETIEGRAQVAAAPADARPGIEARLAADAESTAHVQIGEKRLAWSPSASRFEWLELRTLAEPGGAFRLCGLSPGVYALRIASLDGALCSACSSMDAMEIAAPASDVLLELPAARLEVALSARAGQPAEARLHLASGEGARLGDYASARTLSRGEPALLLVEPGARALVLLEAEGFRRRRSVFTAPAAGEVLREELALEAEPGRAALFLELLGPGGTPVDEATFVFAAQGGSRLDPPLTRNVRSQDGLFRIEDLPPGIYRLKVHAGGFAEHYLAGFCPAELDVDLQAGEEARSSMRLLRGARLRLDVRDETGAPLAAECALRGSGGEPLEVRFVARRPGRTAGDPRRLLGEGPHDVYPVLPPGSYELSLSAPGCAGEARAVELRAGRVEELAVVLRRR
jgi:RNA polymerase sigma-70 factor (ECF subfamily)